MTSSSCTLSFSASPAFASSSSSSAFCSKASSSFGPAKLAFFDRKPRRLSIVAQAPPAGDSADSALLERSESSSSSSSDAIQQFLKRDYKWGFVSDIESVSIPKGLSEDTIRLISAKKDEPPWLLEFRLNAYKQWLKMKEPQWSDNKYPPIDFQEFCYYSEPKQKEKKKSLDEVDPALLETFQKLGIPLTEQKRLANVAVDAVFDSVCIATTHRKTLEAAGVIFCSISEAVKEYPNLVKKYLGRVVPVADNFYAALNSAVFSDGSFCYIPKDTVSPMEISSYFRINALETGQFERTLIVADERSFVSYLEGCTAPSYDKNQLHAAVVELYCAEGAEIKYSTVQKWYAGDEDGRGGIYNFVTKRGLCDGNNSKISWAQVETGSAITWKYPSVVLKGDDSKGEFSVAVTNTAHNARNFSQCDSMLIGDQAAANTYPYIQVPDHLLPKVAIVGRPNVGKSALFNRLAGGELAIVNDEPGVTRDRLYARGFWGLQEFMLVDTGGLLSIPKSGSVGTDGIAITGGGGQNAITQAVREASMAGLPAMIERQAAAALEDAAAIIFVVDGQAGVTSIDEDIANWLRKKHSDKKIILAVNKCESPTRGFQQATEFWSLGLEPIAVSAISGTGTGDLLDILCAGLASFKVEGLQEEENRIPAIAIIGKPNVGKSSILNALAGKERSIVSPISGTTRDAIDTEITGPDGQVYRLIDTAGIRRRGAVAAAGSKTEELSVNRAFRAIRRADVVALVIDAMACVTEQDWKLAERIENEGKGCVIVINKWDTIPDKDNKTTLYYEQDVREKLRVLDWAPIVYTSAIAGHKVAKILEMAIVVEKERSRRLSTAILNQVVQEALALNPPPRARGGKKGRLYYCTQAAVRPPTFVFFVNEAKLFSDVYRRYMEKQLRANVGYHGTPIRLLWRSKKKSERDVPKGAALVGSA